MNTDRFKFRAWDKAWKQMVYPDIIYHNINLGCSIHRAFKPSDGDMYFPLQENLILMQCTGLKDIEGKLIYEGDLVQEKSNTIIYEVRFDIIGWLKYILYDASTTGYSILDSFKEYKIIGNKYELQT